MTGKTPPKKQQTNKQSSYPLQCTDNHWVAGDKTGCCCLLGMLETKYEILSHHHMESALLPSIQLQWRYLDHPSVLIS